MFVLIINKTYMASISKRKQQVNQLRKAHFPFGFEDNKGIRSQYRKEYNEHPLQQPQTCGDRKSHFTIASDQPNMAKNGYQSEFKQKYPEHQFSKQPMANKSNDENNIVLGFGNNQNQTNYKDQFVTKVSVPTEKVNQKIVNVDLGDSLTDFTTSYKRTYDGAQGVRPEKVNSNSGPNLILGYDQHHYTTSNAASHNLKPITNNQAPVRNYGTNITLGGDHNHYHSEQKTQYAHKDSAMETVSKDKVLDFKSAHFHFGFPEQTETHQTQAQAHYSQKQLVINKSEGAKPTNIELKFDSNNYYQSSYGQDFNQKKIAKAEPVDKNGRNSNVIIGMGNETYQTQAKDQFVAKPIHRVKGKKIEGNLQLGGGDRTFDTHYNDTFTNKFNQRQANRVSQQQIAKMRVQNYVAGFDNSSYQLHSHSYGKTPGQHSQLSGDAISKMRSTNIVNSDNNLFHGSTTQKASYGWKRNVDF